MASIKICVANLAASNSSLELSQMKALSDLEEKVKWEIITQTGRRITTRWEQLVWPARDCCSGFPPWCDTCWTVRPVMVHSERQFVSVSIMRPVSWSTCPLQIPSLWRTWSSPLGYVTVITLITRLSLIFIMSYPRIIYPTEAGLRLVKHQEGREVGSVGSHDNHGKASPHHSQHSRWETSGCSLANPWDGLSALFPIDCEPVRCNIAILEQ